MQQLYVTFESLYDLTMGLWLKVLSMLLNVFCFIFLDCLISWWKYNRDTKWHCAFTRSQPADRKYHYKTQLSF